MHFTYKPELTPSLRQGDVLRRTPELLSVLEEYHPHYAEERYTHFQILTQTCDLVLGRRGPHCKARYITIAAIRSISDAINKVIDDKADNIVVFDGDRYASTEYLYELKSFVIKLFNNNEHEYFFLKAAPEQGLGDDSCAFLRLSVALRADEHYQKCLDAKILELSEVFQAKLGWSVGNLYSRVGTDDYIDGAKISKNQLDKLARKMLDNYVNWVPQDRFSDFRKLADMSTSVDEIDAQVEKILQRRREGRLGLLVEAVSTALGLDAEEGKRLTNALSQNVSVLDLLRT